MRCNCCTQSTSSSSRFEAFHCSLVLLLRHIGSHRKESRCHLFPKSLFLFFPFLTAEIFGVCPPTFRQKGTQAVEQKKSLYQTPRKTFFFIKIFSLQTPFFGHSQFSFVLWQVSNRWLPSPILWLSNLLKDKPGFFQLKEGVLIAIWS